MGWMGPMGPMRKGCRIILAEEIVRQGRDFDTLVERGHPLLVVERKDLLPFAVVEIDGKHPGAHAHDDGDDGDQKDDAARGEEVN